MKNFEKYIDEILKTGSLRCGFSRVITKSGMCDSDCNKCEEKSKKWLLADCEEPYKLSQLEYEILRNLGRQIIYTKYDEDEDALLLYQVEIERHIYDCGIHFCFMKEGQIYSASEILSNCEVINDVN